MPCRCAPPTTQSGNGRVDPRREVESSRLRTAAVVSQIFLHSHMIARVNARFHYNYAPAGGHAEPGRVLRRACQDSGWYSQTRDGLGGMRKVWTAAAALISIGVLSGFQNFQKAWREYPAFEYNTFPIPTDYQEKTEFVFARFMYPDAGFGGGFRRFRGGYGDWRSGRTFWTMDYPRSDRHLMLALRRLSRIHARSVEQPINLEEHDQYDWPWLYGVEVGHWELTDLQAKRLREYLLRGGFFMCDDFHGTREWQIFM